MRHTTTAAGAVALLLALTACSSSDTSDAGGSKPSPTADPADQYLTASQDIPFTTHRPADTELTAFPPKWCAGLDEGHSVTWLFSGGGGGLYPNGMDWGTVKKNADRLLVVGVRAYCPEHTDTVTAQLRETGGY
ncbi:hypothetical protein [Streptomyces scabiei]|uniref:hypothetical protein n=1 Tax=Streptomyces scabiei TaxID=1930 RepID=UPI00076585C5|nr:hypothetical protein [Streptomyces scabiei]